MKKARFCLCVILYCIILLASLTLFSLPIKVGGLGSSSMIAVSYGSDTVCGILAGKSSRGIQCFRQGETLSILPNISYEAISGGKDFFCGLSSGGSDLFCWGTQFSNPSLQAKKIYHNPISPLSDITVNDHRVCALQSRTGIVQCWERVRSSGMSPFSLPVGEITFDTITSGEGFLCGIVKDERNVLCWGESGMGDFIESQFGIMSMLSLVAGKSHVCGIAMSGVLICKGNNNSGQLDVPSKMPFYYSDLALGRNHTCALQRSNGKVVCWGDFVVQKIQSLSYESIVAGMDFTCGLRNDTLTLTCWGPGWSGKFDSSLPLPSMLPGPCVRDPCRICGVLLHSESLCGGDTNICRSCVVESGMEFQNFQVAQPSPSPMETSSSPPPPPPSSSSSPSSSPSPSKEKYRPIWAYEIFGLVGILSGLYALGYCIYTKRQNSCHQKLQNDKDIKEVSCDGSNNGDTAFVASNASSAPQSRSSSITQLSSMTSLGRQRSYNNNLSSKHVEKAETFTLFELATATKNFSLENKIGRGSFGTVYRGTLLDGRQVAIKREEIGTRKERGNAFESELTLLSRVHHKHLVGLIGFCEENKERLLVYEYMSNGALYDHLHSKNNNTLNSWEMRIKIGLDAARGIEYLHNYAVPPIIHRDIKSSNILLDGKWVARVSDFGLSLKRPECEKGSSMSVKAVGTVGYIDPEYYVLKVLTTKSDVYGFGVVLLELLTGKRAVFKEDEGNGPTPTGVVEYAGPFIVAGEVSKVLDKRVEQPLMNESEAVELLAYTAMMCVNLEGKDRPTMSDIVSNLERALALCKGGFGTFSPAYSFS